MTRRFTSLLLLGALLLSFSVEASADRRRHYGRRVSVDVDVHRHRRSGAGAFVAGAIVGGAISSATRPRTVVVVAPQVGYVAPYLPPSCTQVISRGVVYQHCDGNYYEPFYQGGVVSYRVVAPF